LESCDRIRSALSCSKNLPSAELIEDEAAGILSVHISSITSYLVPNFKENKLSSFMKLVVKKMQIRRAIPNAKIIPRNYSRENNIDML
jgi:hypothetical protein